MKLIQTLYIDKDKEPFKDSFGWASPEYHLMSWALSCLQLQKIYQGIELYANCNGANLLIDILDLPYHRVNITHNHLSVPNKNLWAVPKIFTYSLQEEPFLHFDGDVFLFNRLPEILLDSGLIAQNIEEATTDYYTQTQMELINHFTYFPDCVENDFKSGAPIKAINAGILGGIWVIFMKHLAREVIFIF